MPSRLFRSILRAHRSLPPKQRQLGDAYVKAEFRAHRNAKPEFVTGFVAQWQNYLDMLQSQVSVGQPVGAHLTSSEKQGLSDEQKQQLSKLEASARDMA